MIERGPIFPSETFSRIKVSPEGLISLQKDKLMGIISAKAEEVRDQLVASKFNFNATIGVAIDLGPEGSIEPVGCWIISNRPSMHNKLVTTGCALMKTREIVVYETYQDINNKPALSRVHGDHLGEIITKSPFDPEEYIDNGILFDLDKLSEQAKIAAI